ncbi:MAG: serine hydrolase domain-containing protein [Gemmatimonadaceae bacterium]
MADWVRCRSIPPVVGISVMLVAVLFAAVGALAPTLPVATSAGVSHSARDSVAAISVIASTTDSIGPGTSGLPLATSATAVGMSADRLDAINRIVERGITAGGYPGAAVVVGRKGMSVLQKGYGRLSWSADSPNVDPTNSIYDIASLSKVVGTTTAIMLLYDQGRISLDAPVSRYLPDFSGGEKDLVTIRLLLTHRSGLPPGRDIWRLTHDPIEAKRIILSTPLAFHPGQYYEYSDLGADVLGMIVESVSAQPLDEFLADYVFHPLGMYDTFYNPADSVKHRIAPTEIAPPRGYPIQGEVHDENAFAMGGVAGHAGIFSSASDLSVFAQMMLNGGEYNGVRILAESTVMMFTTRAAGHRALGWDTPTGSYGSGYYLSGDAFGHTGFTGTSMWIDPDRGMFIILLTNRVHAARALHPLQVIADVRSDLSDAATLAITDMPMGEMAMPASFRADREVGWNNPERSSSRGAGGRARHAKSLSSNHGKRSAKSRSGSGSAAGRSSNRSSASSGSRGKSSQSSKSKRSHRNA